MKQTFYFPHDYNASNDIKILFLRQQLGMEGYGIYWYIVENLATAKGKLPLNITPILAMQMQVSEVKVMAVIQKFELFVIDEDKFFSKRLNDHLDLRNVLSEKGKIGSNKRWNNGVANGGAIRVANGEAITLPNGEAYAKERKGKEIKEIGDFLTKIKI